MPDSRMKSQRNMQDLAGIHIQLEWLDTPEIIDQRKQWALHSACAIFRFSRMAISTGSDFDGPAAPPVRWPEVMIREPEFLPWKPVGVVITEHGMRQAAERGIETWIDQLENAVGDLISSGLSVVGVAQGASRQLGSTQAFVQWARLVVERTPGRQFEAA